VSYKKDIPSGFEMGVFYQLEVDFSAREKDIEVLH
jgi:hypothetical protein